MTTFHRDRRNLASVRGVALAFPGLCAAGLVGLAVVAPPLWLAIPAAAVLLVCAAFFGLMAASCTRQLKSGTPCVTLDTNSITCTLPSSLPALARTDVQRVVFGQQRGVRDVRIQTAILPEQLSASLPIAKRLAVRLNAARGFGVVCFSALQVAEDFAAVESAFAEQWPTVPRSTLG